GWTWPSRRGTAAGPPGCGADLRHGNVTSMRHAPTMTAPGESISQRPPSADRPAGTPPATGSGRPSASAAALAGVAAGALGLGVSELIAGLIPGATSLVAAIGQLVIDLQPP